MTIKDLAAKTGYAVATVSRVLNDHPNVSPRARSVIMQAVEESGFQLNVNAKQLKQQRATSILVIVKGTSNELFSELVESIQALVAKTHYPLHVDYLDEDGDEVLRAVQLCREKKPLGILFLGGNSKNFLNHFDKVDIPCVLVTNSASQFPFPNLSSVAADDRQAARDAIDALIGLGHREFAVIGGDRANSDTSRLRYEGCQLSFREHGIAFDEELDYAGVRFSYEDGYRAAAKLLESGRRFTALFAISDVMAIGAIRALKDHGLKVPEDVSVLGYDGLPLGTYLVPQLSTVGQPVHEMAQRSVSVLLSCIEGQGMTHHEVVLHTLHLRESTSHIQK